MASIRYRVKGTGVAPIYLRLSISRGNIWERKTGLLINRKEWSESTGLPRQTLAENKNLSISLQKLSIFIFKSLNENTSERINGEWLQHQINIFFGKAEDEQGNNRTVIRHINEIVKTAHVRENSKGGIGISKDRIQKYTLLTKIFNEFQGRKEYKVTDLTAELFRRFRDWLLSEKMYAPSTALKKVQDLKTVCVDAMGKGYAVAPTLLGVKISRLKTYSKDREPIYLDEGEIQKIEMLPLTEERLINARKWLILACYTGQRGGDLLRLKKENIKQRGENSVIEIIQGKGNKPITIPVLPKVSKIIKSGLPYPISLPYLSCLFKQLGQLAEINTKVQGRKRVQGRGVLMELPKWEFLSTHVGRRSFATNHYGMLDNSIIMGVTGHSREDTFRLYVNKEKEVHINAFFNLYKNKEVKMTVSKRNVKKVANK